MSRLSPLLFLSLFLSFGYASCKPPSQLQGRVNSSAWKQVVGVSQIYDLFNSSHAELGQWDEKAFESVMETFRDAVRYGRRSAPDTDGLFRSFGITIHVLSKFKDHPYISRVAAFFDELAASVKHSAQFIQKMYEGEFGFYWMTIENVMKEIVVPFLRNPNFDSRKCTVRLDPFRRLQELEKTVMGRLFYKARIENRHSYRHTALLREFVEKIALINTFAAFICHETAPDTYPFNGASEFDSIHSLLLKLEKRRSNEADDHTFLEAIIRDHTAEFGQRIVDWRDGMEPSTAGAMLGALAIKTQGYLGTLLNKTIAIYYMDYGEPFSAQLGNSELQKNVFSFNLGNEMSTQVYVLLVNRFLYEDVDVENFYFHSKINSLCETKSCEITTNRLIYFYRPLITNHTYDYIGVARSMGPRCETDISGNEYERDQRAQRIASLFGAAGDYLKWTDEGYSGTVVVFAAIIASDSRPQLPSHPWRAQPGSQLINRAARRPLRAQ